MSRVLGFRTRPDLVAGSELAFRDHGSHELKGLPEQLRLFALQEANGAS